MKKKNIKAIATILSLALLITMIPVNTVTANAATKKTTVNLGNGNKVVYTNKKTTYIINGKKFTSYTVNGKKYKFGGGFDPFNQYDNAKVEAREYFAPLAAKNNTIKVKKVTKNSITIKWNKGKIKPKSNTKNLTYHITVSELKNPKATQYSNKYKVIYDYDTPLKTKKTSITIKNLKPNKKYRILVKAFAQGKTDKQWYGGEASWYETSTEYIKTKKK